MKEPLPLWQQPLPAPRLEEQILLHRWEPRLAVELPQPIAQLWRELPRGPEEQFLFKESVLTEKIFSK